MARGTFSNPVQLAKDIESSTSGVVGYGLGSKPVTDADQDSLWRGMLYAMRSPAAYGLKVDDASTEGMQGYMQRTMRTLERPGIPTVTNNIRVIESAQEITYKPLVNGVESRVEQVFALRRNPLRMEMFKRGSNDTYLWMVRPHKSICILTQQSLRPSGCKVCRAIMRQLHRSSRLLH